MDRMRSDSERMDSSEGRSSKEAFWAREWVRGDRDGKVRFVTIRKGGEDAEEGVVVRVWAM